MKRGELNQLWNSVIGKLFINDSDKRANLLTLLEGSRLEQINETKNSAIISTNSEFTKNLLESENFKNEILKSINEVFNSNFDVVFIEKSIWDKRASDYATEEVELNTKPSNLKPNFTLDNFLASGKGENRMIKQAALSVSLKPGNWTPFFIYGGSGLGKTHLLHAIGNKISEQFPHLKIRYLECKDFKDLVYDGDISTEKIKDINEEFLAYDVLLIDDIQMLETLSKAKEVFFGIFSNFINENKQVVITSDRYPEEMKEFEERFITRFKGGILLSVTPPDLDTAKAILKQKLEKNDESGGLKLSESALEFIATSFGSNIRELEGALNKIIFWSITNNEMKNEYMVEDMLNIFEGMTTSRGLTMNRISSVVAKNYQISSTEMLGKTRKAEIALPRHIAVYFCRSLLDVSLMDIGRFFGRDHSTVMSSVRKIEKEAAVDQEMNKVIYDLRKKLISYK